MIWFRESDDMEKEFLLAMPIIEALETRGYEAFFVGGAVRDRLIGRPIHDVDIATSAAPGDIQKVFPKTIDVGAEHGTIIVIHSGHPYEVTTFRTESGYADHRRPDRVTFVTSLLEDMKRRDFKMNALAMDKKGKIYDYFNGREDLQAGLISAVGNPAERFSEDALRMLRALRFSSQLGFSVSEEALYEIEKLAGLMKDISAERKLAEVDKLLQGKNVNAALRLLIRTGLHEYLPGFGTRSAGLHRFSGRSFEKLEANERWALLLYDIRPDDPKDFLKHWKMSGSRIAEIAAVYQYLLARLAGSWTEELLYEAGGKTVISTEKICSEQPEWSAERDAADRYRQLPIFSRKDLAVNGNDLLRIAGKPPGSWVSALLGRIEAEVLAGRLQNDREEIGRWLENWSRKTET